MKSSHDISRFIICFFVLLLLVLSPLVSPAQSDGRKGISGASGGSEGSEQFVSIDFNNVDINVFIKFISELTNTNFVVDQRVKGKVTIISPAKISVAEAFRVFESVLEVHGYTTVKAGKVIKIVPSTDARSKNVKTLLKEAAGSPNDQVVTQLIPLRYATPVEIKKLFTPLVSKSSVILAYAPTNTIIITDIHSNIKRLLRILKTIDVAGIGREISVIPLLYADAAKFATMLKGVFKAVKKPRPGSVSSVVEFVADDRTNTIVLLASEDDTARIKKLIAMLDKQVPRGDEKIRVYYLENATAEELAKVLQSLSTRSAGSTAKGAKRAAVVSDQVKITADKATNSLIIMADKDDYVVLEDIIRKLDIPRQMVYIEALIIEVNVDK
ncbi:MAG: secretin N-terminal domain-containing protein, partial [Desulfobacterales bacterium]